MNSILTTALKKLPKARTQSDIRFYWRIILEKFRAHENQIITCLNTHISRLREKSLSDDVESIDKVRAGKIIYLTLQRMPELSCDVAFRIWLKVAGIYEMLPEFPSIYHEKFKRLSLQEQLTLLNELSQEELSEDDYAQLGSWLGAINAPDEFKVITDRLKESDLSRKEMRAFLIVVQYMLAHNKPV